MRVRPAAPIGSLLKQAQPVKRRKLDLGRKPREKDDGYLALIRQCPCVVCGISPSREAAHVRMTREGKPIAGIGSKPDDRWSLPICHDDHMEQHRIGEISFWADVGIDPIKLAASLYAASSLEQMISIVSVARARAVVDPEDGSD